MKTAAMDRHSEEMVKRFDIRPTDYKLPTSSLSGGNAQKVVVAREVSMNKKLLVAAQPTRGVDIGAIESIQKTVEEAKKNGAGVLLVSTELEEITSLSDRIIVIHEGTITGELSAGEANENNLGLLMMGGTVDHQVKEDMTKQQPKVDVEDHQAKEGVTEHQLQEGGKGDE